ncbi:Phage terminase small subunit [Chryseobacterium ureilyticum]|uniref:Phage terminase small subunit n=1 Tax=Chryseobacterium ureilyticum TaxID=373668 RepID=A0A1N7QS03_9FLAO|nr:DUF1804 family protein [Chryseobacterium ureilyticum]SIT25588.1 Phage terminase small subunit [Chryseobacterium ureilyticum]
MAVSKTQQREHARLLYVGEMITLKEVAERVKVTEKTVGKWCKEDNWDDLRKSLLNTRESQLVHFYNQLEAINMDIANRPEILVNGKPIQRPPKNIPTNAEADTISKITSNIQRLEREIGLGEIIQTGKRMILFIQKINLDDAKMFTGYFDEYITSNLKNG